MTEVQRGRAGPRLAALGIALGVLAVFAAANIHLVAVSIASQPDCALSRSNPEGAVAYRAATSSC